jgi:hypothetical protein
MNNRLFAILIVACLALAGGGCASRAHIHRHTHEVLLPRQTGSNLDRRMTVDDESSVKKTIQPESKHPKKKRVKTKRTAPEDAEPEKPEEASTQPDRFR